MTTTVDCLFVNPFGVPIADTAVTFQPLTAGYDATLEGIVMPQEVEAVTDVNGECTVELWPSPIPYIVRCDDTEQEVGISYRIIVPETGVTQRLQDLISASTTVDWWDDATLALILAYRDAAIAAAAAAAASALLAHQTLQAIPVACSDETTAITATPGKVTFHLPYAFTLAGDKVMGELVTPQASGSIFTADINVGGTSILSTKLTIDNTEETSFAAAIPPVTTTNSLAKGAKVVVDVDQIGDGTAKGYKIWLIGYPT